MEVSHTRYRGPMIVRSGAGTGAVRGNREFAERLGLTREDLEARPLLSWLHPEDRPGVEKVLAVGNGCASARHRTKSGEWTCFEWRVATHQGKPAVLGLQRDVSNVPAKPSVADSPEPRTPLAATLKHMAQIVESKNPPLRCSILLLDEKREYVMVGAGPSRPAAYNEAVEGLRIGPAVGSCGTAAFWNLPVVVENIAEDPLWTELREAAALAGVSACWSQPITATNGDTLGAMALYSEKP